MGERKGQNKYYPPDFDYKVHKSLSGYHGEHALRERAKRIDEGILIIRFEMPFNMWCGGCRNHIGMGVRYNAEKSKVGKYYTTPIFKFRMRCHLCPNYIEIQTDPAKAAYVVVSGGERREQRWDAAENGQIAPEKWENKKKLALDSMYKLEHASVDETKGKHFQSNFSSLVGKSDWKNEHMVSRVFSKYFKEQKKKRLQDAAFKQKYALNVDLLSEDEDDDVAPKKIKKLTHSSSAIATASVSKISKDLKGCSKEMEGLLGQLSKKDVPVGRIMKIIERGSASKKAFQLSFDSSKLKKRSSTEAAAQNSIQKPGAEDTLLCDAPKEPTQNVTLNNNPTSPAITTDSKFIKNEASMNESSDTPNTEPSSTSTQNDTDCSPGKTLAYCQSSTSTSSRHVDCASEKNDDSISSSVLTNLMADYGSEDNEEDDEKEELEKEKKEEKRQNAEKVKKEEKDKNKKEKKDTT